MDDLISKKDTLQSIYNIHHWSEQENHEPEPFEVCGYDKVVSAVYDAPSAFEGMTNGEVIQALFPNADYAVGKLFMHITNVNSIGGLTIPLDWWNAPYKGVSK